MAGKKKPGIFSFFSDLMGLVNLLKFYMVLVLGGSVFRVTVYELHWPHKPKPLYTLKRDNLIDPEHLTHNAEHSLPNFTHRKHHKIVKVW